jgi:prepilin peptidase CpaA
LVPRVVDRYFLICATIVAVAGAILDVRSRRIPNWLTYLGLFSGLAVRLFLLGWPGLKAGLVASLAAGGALFVLFVIGGMGAGDVKMMAAVGAWAGTAQMLTIFFVSAIAGGLLAVGMMLFHGRVRTTLANSVELVRHHLIAGLHPHPELNIKEPASMRVPFAPAIAIGTVYCLGQTLGWG